MKSIRIKLLLALTVFTSLAAFASVPPPVTGSSSPSCWPPPCVPIDGGVVFLIIAGVLFAAKKIYDSRKKPLTHS